MDRRNKRDSSERRERSRGASPNNGRYQRSPSRARSPQQNRNRGRSPEGSQVRWSTNSLDKKEKIHKLDKKREAIKRRMKKYSNALGVLETKVAALSGTDTDSDVSSGTSFNTSDSDLSGNE